MPIDLFKEKILSLTEAAKLKSLPTRRGGKRPHVSCFYRWTGPGCRGVVLESVQIGGTRCTSLEALSRFFARLTEERTHLTHLPRVGTAREPDIAAAERELASD
ncbi:MAG TPA: DUF1580 domain-containing protein [Pirellulales bacterium]|nr:DUF1580 domain-containing protein [Pirellulales bacterium]